MVCLLSFLIKIPKSIFTNSIVRNPKSFLIQKIKKASKKSNLRMYLIMMMKQKRKILKMNYLRI